MTKSVNNHTASRKKLPNIRSGLTKKCDACGFRFYITVNFYDDGKPGEVFCRIAKEGSVISGFIEALCITISVSMQYGVPWEVLYNKYLHQTFEPKDDTCSSLVDAIGKEITSVISQWSE